MFETFWKRLGKLIKRVRKLIELSTKYPPLGKNMIKFEHDGLQISCQKICWKGYDGVNASRWNLEVEPFVA